MHFILILLTLGFAYAVRNLPYSPTGTWSQRWQKSLFLFLFSPLLLLMTALAVLSMGANGEMLGLKASWFSYSLALIFVGMAIITGLQFIRQLWQSQQRINTLSQEVVSGRTARILEDYFPYSAQVGFWQPQLVVSRGLLTLLDTDHLEAVLAHEQAHLNYRDTFWFFVLGWLRTFTAWLPQTEALWQELLLLREMRADHYAVQTVDPLLLAESLLYIAKAPFQSVESPHFSFSCSIGSSRLEERIDAILTVDSSPLIFNSWTLILLLSVLLPWLTVPFHS